MPRLLLSCRRWPWRDGPKACADPRQQRGRRAERLAREHLRRAGMAIEAVNVRMPVGEVDVIARDGTTLCFVEVRSRASQAYGGALESIQREKQRRLVRAAQWYLSRRRAQPVAVRFDVVSVEWTVEGPASVTHVRGAFDAGEEAGW